VWYISPARGGVASAIFFEQKRNRQKSQKRNDILYLTTSNRVILSRKVFVKVFLASLVCMKRSRPELIFDHRRLSYFGHFTAMGQHVTSFVFEPLLGTVSFGEIMLGSIELDQMRATFQGKSSELDLKIPLGENIVFVCGGYKQTSHAEGIDMPLKRLSPTLTRLALAIQNEDILADGDTDVFHCVCQIFERKTIPVAKTADALAEAA
jgi:hypothetical protein